MGNKQRKGLWGWFAAGAAGLKFAPLLKFAALAGKFKSLLLMVASLGAYTMMWGWRYAAGFMLLLFVHELGHVIELRRQGVKASLPMFIPFLGAFVAVKERQTSVVAEARSALAGPVAGLGVSALVAYLAGTSQLLMALSYSGFFLNLFNLIPFLPLDGGRAAGALSRKMWVIGMVMALGLMVYHPSPVLLLVLLLGGVETVSRLRNNSTEDGYNHVPAAARRRIAAVYIGCVVVALMGMDFTHVPTESLN